MDESVFVNGEFFKKEDAKISVVDIGLTRSFGIYEGIAAIGERIFRLEDHLVRMRDSADFLGLTISYSNKEIQDLLVNLIKKNPPTDRSNIKIYITGGPTIDGIDFDTKDSTFIALSNQYKPIAKESYTNGAKIITYDHLRFMPMYKTTNYITAVLVQKKRKEADALEVLFTDEGTVFECSTSNIFGIKNGVVITPNENILKGITRKVVLEIALKLGLKTEERRMTVKELFELDELFLTSSFKDVVPLVTVDDKQIGNGKAGPITYQLMVEFGKVLGFSEI